MLSDAVVISARKLRANRRNAQKSTGPRTDAGKVRSSRNAVVHGLFCKSLILPGEDAEYFHEFQIDMLKTLNPCDALELSFVQQIVSAAWRLKRVPAAEASIFAMQQQELDQKFAAECKKREDALMMKLGAARFADRAAIQSEIKALEQQVRENPPAPRSAGELMAIMLSRKEAPASLALERLHRHEQRLAGTITRGLKHLNDLRQHALSDEPSELTCAILIEAGDEKVQNEPTEGVICDNSCFNKGLDGIDEAPSRALPVETGLKSESDEVSKAAEDAPLPLRAG